jgi:hypothetical protein
MLFLVGLHVLPHEVFVIYKVQSVIVEGTGKLLDNWILVLLGSRHL